jgi:hypothetical protein
MTDDLKSIFAAIDEINAPKKKKLEVKKNVEYKSEKILVLKDPVVQEKNYLHLKDNIPANTENFILEAEQQLKSIKKK